MTLPGLGEDPRLGHKLHRKRDRRECEQMREGQSKELKAKERWAYYRMGTTSHTANAEGTPSGPDRDSLGHPRHHQDQTGTVWVIAGIITRTH